MALRQKLCEDLQQLIPKDGHGDVCFECIKTGDTWVHLRTCQECGVTLCCDSSPNQHMTKHYLSHGHSVVVSAEPGERWAYCYEHKLFTSF